MDALNVLNPKQLERQIKVLDGRITELRRKLDRLEKRKAACQLLLGVEGEELTGVESAAAEAPRSRPRAESKDNMTDLIASLLSRNTDGLSADAIYDALRSEDAKLPRKGAVE